MWTNRRYLPYRTKVRKEGEAPGHCGPDPGRSKGPGLTPKGEEEQMRWEVFREPVSWTAPDFQMTGQA